jgi:hypothetical protein
MTRSPFSQTPRRAAPRLPARSRPVGRAQRGLRGFPRATLPALVRPPESRAASRPGGRRELPCFNQRAHRPDGHAQPVGHFGDEEKPAGGDNRCHLRSGYPLYGQIVRIVGRAAYASPVTVVVNGHDLGQTRDCATGGCPDEATVQLGSLWYCDHHAGPVPRARPGPRARTAPPWGPAGNSPANCATRG